MCIFCIESLGTCTIGTINLNAISSLIVSGRENQPKNETKTSTPNAREAEANTRVSAHTRSELEARTTDPRSMHTCHHRQLMPVEIFTILSATRFFYFIFIALSGIAHLYI